MARTSPMTEAFTSSAQLPPLPPNPPPRPSEAVNEVPLLVPASAPEMFNPPLPPPPPMDCATTASEFAPLVVVAPSASEIDGAAALPPPPPNPPQDRGSRRRTARGERNGAGDVHPAVAATATHALREHADGLPVTGRANQCRSRCQSQSSELPALPPNPPTPTAAVPLLALESESPPDKFISAVAAATTEALQEHAVRLFAGRDRCRP